MNYRELSESEVMIHISDGEVNSSTDLKEIPLILGQPRAFQALKMGTGINQKGYNIFVTGLSGTGRVSGIKKILDAYKPNTDNLKDIVYVFNFKSPDSPNVLYLPKNGGVLFKERIHNLIETMKDTIRNRLDSDVFKVKRDELVSKIEQEENHTISDFESVLNKRGFQIIQIQDDESDSMDIIPIWEGEGISFDKLQELVKQGTIDEAYWNDKREKYYGLMDDMKHVFQDIDRSRTALEGKISNLKVAAIKPDVESIISKLIDLFTEEEVKTYLEDLKDDMISNMFLFVRDQPTDENGNSSLLRYGVNVIVDHSLTDNVPIIFENHPRYTNLFGTIETGMDLNGERSTNFMMLKAGSLIRASGGFIVLKAEDVLGEEAAWDNLKRALQTGKVEIQPQGGPFNLQNSAIKPGPVKINTKVIMVGNENLYDVLFATDRDFQKHFKVSAEFDSEMDRNDENIGQYVNFIKMVTKEEDLREPDLSGIKEIIRYGISLSEQKDKLSTRFSLVADLIREANYWANAAGEGNINQESVINAIKKRKYLYDLPEERINSMILKGEILIKVDGEAVGRVNGLAIHDRGYYSFGTPTVISAQVSPGNEGIINIEREAGLSGEIHDKGIMILEGYLRDKYARNFPLSVYASICFEQSYSEIDGDSASSTEVYGLLSAIAGIPLRQYIAVTGSVNQMGQIQPVGGITEKVLGFFTICRQSGLTGRQGVLIPEQNINNLILPKEVSNEIRDGNFHIYPVSSIDEGLEVLTGMEVGIRNKKGNYTAGSFNYAVEVRLKEIAQLVKAYNG